MKKTIAFILCLALLLTMSCSIPISAEEDTTVAGLAEKMDVLFLRNHFDQSEIEEMDKEFMDYFEDFFWNHYLPTTKKLGRMNTGSDEEEYSYMLERDQLDYSKGVLVTCLNSYKYWKQYAEGGNLDYMFSEQKYWSIPEKYVGVATFNVDGILLRELKLLGTATNYPITIDKKAYEFIYDKEKIQKLLAEKGESIALDCKIISMDAFEFLYIKCENKEYLIKLGASSGGPEWVPQMELFKLYSMEEVMEFFKSLLDAHPLTDGKGLAEYVHATKPTFTAEAEALQTDGLLNGTEKGLDLLKPLTRIEAAAMLLRAIGKPETAPEGSVQIFSDVSENHWGFGAAAQAYNIGLIKGVVDSEFAPDKTVAATEFATMVLRAAKTDEFDWQQALNILIEKGIITKEDASTMDLFTRGDMAKIIHDARAKGLL